MTDKTEKVNYDEKAVALMLETYDANADVETRKAAVEKIAEALGKKPRSVIAKLSNLGVYVKPERTAKDGSEVVRKADLATEIGEILGLAENDASSLEKATKTALKRVLAAVKAEANVESD